MCVHINCAYVIRLDIFNLEIAIIKILKITEFKEWNEHLDCACWSVHTVVLNVLISHLVL